MNHVSVIYSSLSERVVADPPSAQVDAVLLAAALLLRGPPIAPISTESDPNRTFLVSHQQEVTTAAESGFIYFFIFLSSMCVSSGTSPTWLVSFQIDLYCCY